jgi:hypothetical protein
MTLLSMPILIITVSMFIPHYASKMLVSATGRTARKSCALEDKDDNDINKAAAIAELQVFHY